MGMISAAPQSAQQVLKVRQPRKVASHKHSGSLAMGMATATVTKRKPLGRRVPGRKQSY